MERSEKLYRSIEANLKAIEDMRGSGYKIRLKTLLSVSCSSDKERENNRNIARINRRLSPSRGRTLDSMITLFPHSSLHHTVTPLQLFLREEDVTKEAAQYLATLVDNLRRELTEFPDAWSIITNNGSEEDRRSNYAVFLNVKRENKQLRERNNTLQGRYDEARDRAQRLSFRT
jgi:hypothetical protein